MSIPPEAIEAAKRAVAKAMRQRTYDRHAYDAEVFMEGVADIAAAALEAAAPRLGAKQERERLMRKLDAETISHQDRGQIGVRQWARAWIREQGIE